MVDHGLFFMVDQELLDYLKSTPDKSRHDQLKTVGYLGKNIMGIDIRT